jgi:hypothetical protein
MSEAATRARDLVTSPGVRATALLATFWVGGCSFALARRPPQDYGAMASFECTKSVGPAVVDTTLATMYGALTAGNEVARLHGDGAWFVGSSGFSILLGTTAAVYGASAAWGFIAAHECREALKHSVELTPEAAR